MLNFQKLIVFYDSEHLC